MEFEVTDWVFLKVYPMKRVIRLVKKGNLSPRYIGRYKFVRRIRNVAYELDLPVILASIHCIFNVFMLKNMWIILLYREF